MGPMLAQCWPIVCDAGPALIQHGMSMFNGIDCLLPLFTVAQQTRDVDLMLS